MTWQALFLSFLTLLAALMAGVCLMMAHFHHIQGDTEQAKNNIGGAACSIVIAALLISRVGRFW